MPEPTRYSPRPGDSWRSLPSEDRYWAEFDSEYVLFHRPSGRTHFLNHSAFLLLEEVLSEPLHAPTVAERLAQAHGEPNSEGFSGQVEALLVRLEELGLVERL